MNTSVSSRYYDQKRFDDESSSSEDAAADWKRQSPAETRSASFINDKSSRDKTRALMSRSLDGTSRASSSARGSAPEMGTGRPLARRRRISPHGRSVKASSGGSRERRPTTTVRDSVTSAPAQLRYSVNNSAPRVLEEVHRLRRPGREVSPAYLKRATGMPSDSRGVETGGHSPQGRASSSILSQRKTGKAERSHSRPTPSVRFSSLAEEKVPRNKGRHVENVASRRSATPVSKTDFSSGKHDPPDDSFSSSTTELEQQVARRRVRRSKTSPDLMSRDMSSTRGRSKGHAFRSPSAQERSKGGVGVTTKYEPSRLRNRSRKLSSSSDTTSGSDSSPTSSTSGSSSSSGEENERGVAMPGRVPRTPKACGRKTVGSQTVDLSTTHRRSTSKGSRRHPSRPVKRVASRDHSSRHSPRRMVSNSSPSKAIQTHRQANRRSPGRAATSDAPGKVSRSTSPILINRRSPSDVATAPATYSSGQVFGVDPMTTPKGQLHTQGLPAHRVPFKTSGGTQQFEDKGVAVSATLPREEDTGSSSTTVSSDKDVVPESPRAGPSASLGSGRVRDDDTDDVAAERSDTTTMRYHRNISDLTLAEEGEGRPLEPTYGRSADDTCDTQGNAALHSRRSFTDVVRLTLSDDGGHTDAEPGLVVGPDALMAGEVEQCSSSYLGGQIVIPPSVPIGDSPREPSQSQIENVQVPGTKPQPQPQQERPVIAEGRRDTPAEAAVRSPWRSRFWQPWSLCSAAGVMMLVPLAFVLAPMLGSGPGDGKGTAAGARSALNDTSSTGRDGSARRVLSLQDVYVEDAEVADACNGTARRQPENGIALADGGPYHAPYKPDADLKPQFRPVLCVFDTEYLHPKRPYTPLQIPTSFCSTIVFYSLSFSRFNTAVDSIALGGFRRPLDVEFFDNVSSSRFDGRLHHRGRRIPLYATFGGRRSDSAEFVRMLRDPAWRKSTVEGIVNDTALSERPKYDGVNLDWNHPGDSCDLLRQPQLFHVLVESIGSARVKVMLTVPPLPRYAALYDLEPLLDSVTYVVVATHKLRPRGSVYCSGGRLYAAQAFREIRDSYSVAYRRKFAYSMSAGGDTFVTATVALGSPSLQAPPPSGSVLHPNKTSFESVCNVAPLFVNPDDMECVMAIMQVVNSADANKLYHVAAYAGPKQLHERMHRAYADDMGDAPVALFDAHLDDFAGICPGDSPRMSPQIAAIAEGTRRDLE